MLALQIKWFKYQAWLSRAAFEEPTYESDLVYHVNLNEEYKQGVYKEGLTNIKIKFSSWVIGTFKLTLIIFLKQFAHTIRSHAV